MDKIAKYPQRWKDSRCLWTFKKKSKYKIADIVTKETTIKNMGGNVCNNSVIKNYLCFILECVSLYLNVVTVAQVLQWLAG